MSLLLAAIPTNLVALQSGVVAKNTFTSPTTATLSFESDGEISGVTSATLKTWYSLAPVVDVGSSYEIFATRVSGDPLTSGALDSWLPLSSSRSWSVTQPGVGLSESVILVKIRDSLGNILTEASFTIKVEVFI